MSHPAIDQQALPIVVIWMAFWVAWSASHSLATVATSQPANSGFAGAAGLSASPDSTSFNKRVRFAAAVAEVAAIAADVTAAIVSAATADVVTAASAASADVVTAGSAGWQRAR